MRSFLACRELPGKADGCKVLQTLISNNMSEFRIQCCGTVWSACPCQDTAILAGAAAFKRGFIRR